MTSTAEATDLESQENLVPKKSTKKVTIVPNLGSRVPTVDETEETFHVAETKRKYQQHDDPDVIIPDEIAGILLISAQLLLLTAVLAACFGRYGLAAVTFAVYLTSLLHWQKPRFSGIARKLDYLAVLTALGYGSYVATTLLLKYELAWFIGFGIATIIFVINETLYYIQVSRTIDGSAIEPHPWATKPNTAERDWVYKRTTYVHLFGIHVLFTALALTLIIGGGDVSGSTDDNSSR